MENLETWSAIQEKDIKISWLVDKIIPENAVNVLYGAGGVGKTWLILDIARCIGNGKPWLDNHECVKRPVVYVDFENSLPVLNERLKKLGTGEGVFFWRANNKENPAPKLNSVRWEKYKELPEGSVIIFDSLRSSQTGGENSSDAMAAIMGRLKILRDLGYTIILLHHTRKNSNSIKGSSAIVDLSDHVLSLNVVGRSERGMSIILPDEEDIKLYRFGTAEKTRYIPYHVNLSFEADKGFVVADDPIENILESIHELLMDSGTVKLTTGVRAMAKQIGMSIHGTRKLINKGTGKYWTLDSNNEKNTVFIIPRDDLKEEAKNEKQ